MRWQQFHVLAPVLTQVANATEHFNCNVHFPLLRLVELLGQHKVFTYSSNVINNLFN